MKRTYIKPAVEILDLETKATCVVDSWNVRGENYDPSTDHGDIIEDQGKGNNGEDDPWDYEKW